MGCPRQGQIAFSKAKHISLLDVNMLSDTARGHAKKTKPGEKRCISESESKKVNQGVCSLAKPE